MKQLRERLQAYGAHTLTIEELLLLILTTGPHGTRQQERLQALLPPTGEHWRDFMHTEFHELCQQYQLGPATTAQLQATLEFARRLHAPPLEKYKIINPHDAAKLVMPDMAHLDHEEMRVLLLNTKHQVVDNSVLYKGTVNGSVVRAAEVFRPAITRNMPGIILCHNHPSNVAEPSPEDIQTTEQLVQAGQVLEIELIDHIIIGGSRFVSLRERLQW